MKKLLLAAMLACAVLTPGCKTPPATESRTSETLIANAEKTLAISHATLHAFFTWELHNRAVVPPDVTKVADKLRSRAPSAFVNARAALRAYKYGSRTDEQLQLVNTFINDILELENQARLAQP